MNKILKLGALSGAVAMVSAPAAFADSMITVDPDNAEGWTAAANVAAGTTTYVDGAPAGLGASSLQLKTTSSNLDKATYGHAENIQLSELTSASYWTKQVASSSLGGSASMTFAVDLNGDNTWDTNLVYEPYWQNELSPDPDPVVAGEWQKWDVKDGMFWSTKSYGAGDAALVAGAGGAPFYSLDSVLADYPDAKLMVIGVGVGSTNPDYTIGVDGVELNGVTYNFEKVASSTMPTSKEDCKKDGWKTLKNVDGRMFSNQGQCVSFMAKQQASADAEVKTDARAMNKSER